MDTLNQWRFGLAVAVAVSGFGGCLTCCYMCMCYHRKSDDDDGEDLRFDGMFLEPCLLGSMMVFIKLSCMNIM